MAGQVESWFGRMAGRIGRLLPIRPSSAALVLILATEFALLMINARLKPFWYDEVCTFYYASIHPYSELVTALRNGADTMTVVFMSIMFTAASLPGDPHVNLRLPVILGYLLTLTGAFLFVRKRYGGTAAVVAVLVICLSPFRPYGIEARPYALLVGFLAMSAACWQRAGEYRFALPLLWLFFPLAVTVHYYAALAIAGLACAEAVYVFCERRTRWPVWILPLVCTGLVLAMMPFARAANRVYGGTIWAKPDLSQFLRTYTTYLRLDINLALMILVLASLVFPALMIMRKRQWTDGAGFTAAESALAFSFVLYPAAVVGAAMAASSGYTPRYGWPAILGLAFLAAVVFDAFKDRIVAFAMVTALAVSFSAQAAKDIGKAWKIIEVRNPARQSSPVGLSGIAALYPDHVLVIGDGTSYLELFYYASDGLRRRMIQLTDTTEAVKLTNQATVDITNRQLARFAPLRIEDRGRFLARHKEFILYSSRRPSEWVTQSMLRQGGQLRLLRESGGAAIYLVRVP